MCTRGSRLVHFRGRYYRFYDKWNSRPDDYGSDIVNEIPIDEEEYQKWLAQQRAKASEWASALDKFLHVKRPVTKGIKDQEFDDGLSETASKVSEGALQHWTYDVVADVKDPPLPSYMPVFNDPDIKHGWIDALDKTYDEHRLVLPDLLPGNVVTSLVVRPDPPDARLTRLYEKLDIEIVTSAGINGFRPSQRLESLLCARIFQIFQRTQEQVLAHLLLGWKPDDLCFREIAFTVLCLASGRRNVSLVEEWRFVNDDAHGCANLMSSTDQEEEPEFVAHMRVGAHLNDYVAGSAPQSSMYWFEGVLVHLVARLDKPEAIPQSVARVTQRARKDFPWQPVDVVLISIAHVVLVRVFPGSKAQHTKPLPLFIFGDQPSLDPRERFPPSKLEEILQRKERITAKKIARAERQVRRRDDPDATESGDNDSQEWDWECDEYGNEYGNGSISDDLPNAIDLEKVYRVIAETEPSFFALALLFDASKRAPGPLSATARGYFPIEIYRLIINHVEDVETLGACLAVSSQFRELCSPSPSIIDGFTLLSNEATSAYTHAQEVWNEEKPPFRRPNHIQRWRMLKATEPSLLPGVRVVEQATGSERDITIDRVIWANHLSRIRQMAAYEKTWRVVVGRFRHRRSILLDMDLAFKSVEQLLRV